MTDRERNEASEPNREDDEQDLLSEAFREGTAVDEALLRAARRARRENKRAGNAVVVSRDGKAVELPAEEIPVDEE